MRLNEYIKSENNEKLYSFLDDIKRDCRPYLNDIKFKYNVLSRGMKEIDPYGKKTVRQNRLPKDTPKYIHEELDDLFLKYHGWRARSQGLFAFAEKSKALNYGNVYYIFPIGNYKYLWSPSITDLYLKIDNFTEDFKIFNTNILYIPLIYFSDKTIDFDIEKHHSLNKLAELHGKDVVIKKIKESLNNIVKNIIKSYKNNDIYGYLSSYYSNEIMIRCKEYYYLKEYYSADLNYLFE